MKSPTIIDPIEISMNNIMENRTIFDPDSFKNVPNLKHLVLNLNTVLDVDSLCEALSRLKNLQTLDLSDKMNDFSLYNYLPPNLVELRQNGTGISTIKGDLSQMENSRSSYINNNSLHRSCFESLKVIGQVDIDRFMKEREISSYSIYISDLTHTSDWKLFLGQFSSE